MESSKPVAALGTKPRRRPKKTLEYLKDFAFAIPALAALVLFIYYPLVNSFYLSFTDWNMTRPVKNWVGIENYEWLINSDTFYKVLGITFTYTILDVFLTLGIGLALALLFNVSSKSFGFMRAIIFMPNYISMVVVSMVFLWIFNAQYGFVNLVLNMLGLNKVEWLLNPRTALWVLIIVSIWKGVGFVMIIFISGLRSIPLDYYEASSIDGATKWVQFRKITLPLLSPITLFLVITNFISSMQVFQSVDVMTNGGPLEATKVMVYWIYTMAFSDFRIGRASALVIIFFLIIILLTALQLYISRKKVHYEG